MKCPGIAVVLCVIADIALAQPRLQAQAGLGFTEHFSIGLGCTFSGNHTITLLYGRDFFSPSTAFSTYLIQYHLAVHRWRFSKVTPAAGIRGGHAIFTDKYYTWEVMVFIPFIGMQYPVKNNIDLMVQAGTAISFEQKAKRLNYGEIGHYRQFLPELKAGIVYYIKKKEQ